MFTCAKIRNGKSYLGSHLSANDYYCENERVVGRWTGKGAEHLGLGGEPIEKDDAAFEALRRNLLPDGSGRLTPRKAENGVRFFDFQCAPHKSVSVTAIVMGDERLYKAHDRAAAKAFGELERFAAFRRGRTREAEISGNLCAAAFRHDASRALDPQLHTHFVVANATWDGRRWLALDTCEMFRAIRYAGKVYQNELALECRRLGYDIEPVRNQKGVVEGFQIKGVSQDIQERFSKRRAEVEAGVERFREDKGREPSPQEIHVITRETRNVKLKEITTPEVRARQRGQLSPEESSSLAEVRQAAIARSGGKVRMGSAWKALTLAQSHLFERHSVLPGHKVLAEALNRQLGFIDTSALRRYMASAYNGFVRLVENTGNPLLSCQWCTRRGLRLERWAVEFVNQTQDSCEPLGQTENVPFDFKSGEQEKAVLETLNNRDRVYAIRGCAGAGKTTCLSEIRKGLEAAGRTALYLAPTSSAVEVLRKDGFADATTVDDFLMNRRGDLRDTAIVIDESSLQSNEMGVAVLQAARNARVLFVGDTRQHTSVEAGDFLRVLEQHSKLRHSELNDIRRQQVREYNAAVRSLSQGDVHGGMGQLDALGWIQEGRGAYIRKAADAYLAATNWGTTLDRCIAVAPTWVENHRFTAAVRNGLKQRGVIGEGVSVTVCDPLDWTGEQRRDSANYRPGMLVTFNAKEGAVARGRTFEVERISAGELRLRGYGKSVHLERQAGNLSVSLPRDIEIASGDKVLVRRNHREAGLVNGEVLTVKDINPDGSIETREGKSLPAGFRHFCHGYVVTSHKSQGRTRDQVVIAAERLDAKAAYVACSRGRQSATVFTPDRGNLYKSLGLLSDRTAVSDVTDIRANFWLREESDAHRQAAKGHLPSVALQHARHSNGFGHSNNISL
ncbi:MAG: relaxase domain-containing protein [Acidobacteriota bacterium]|jgi:conjugative relaxase-like TrwC/TraI family protein|nr:relaxase domain-containing protein [Acidobacteriota bacterium]